MLHILTAKVVHCAGKFKQTKKKSQVWAIVTDRGPTLIIQVSKSVFKYGIKINAGRNNKELCST